MSHARYRRPRRNLLEEVPLGKLQLNKLHLRRRLHEGIFITTIAASVFLLLSLFSYHSNDPGWSSSGMNNSVLNIGGYVGAWLADVLLCAFGFVAFIFPGMLIYAAWMPLQKDAEEQDEDARVEHSFLESPKILFISRLCGFIFILLTGSALLSLNFSSDSLSFGAGGILGNLVQLQMVSVFNVIGAELILLALFLTAVTLFSGFSWLIVIDLAGIATIKSIAIAKDIIARIKLRNSADGVVKIGAAAKSVRAVVNSDIAQNMPKLASIAKSEAVASDAMKRVQIVEPQKPKISVRAEKDRQLSLVDFDSTSAFPSLSLLDPPEKTHGNSYTPQQLENMSRDVELRLLDFGIEARVVAVHPGPVVTRFELQLAAGTKVSRITTLAKDLARSLSVVSVRIVEVIPGKSVIGLELPNAHREIVRLREVLSSQQYENSRAPLALALGKDISGNPIVVDLARMPHLLVAGTTGSGKSVGLNAILLSLLYKYLPTELRLILIDPKMLELSIYERIPHLLAPVVTNMKEAANALRWCVAEMERRYRLMMSLGVRNISGFNVKIREAKNKGKPILDPFWEAGVVGGSEEPEELQELAYIVVIADEYADMIMVVGKKVEELIARIAQKARAAGIHLILATQRPSVDVITGLIKANIPTRIAFQVSSKVDSRTILDQSGAEQLLGYGDMLYLPPGSGIPVRIHGAFVADEEVHKVVSDWKRRGQPEYVDEILEGISSSGSDILLGIDGLGIEEEDAERDVLYDQAVRLVTEVRKVSISSVQRRFRIGYNRAARIVEAMEAAGVVSGMESNGNREVLAPPPHE